MLVWCLWLNCRLLESRNYVLSFFLSLTALIILENDEDGDNDADDDEEGDILATVVTNIC